MIFSITQDERGEREATQRGSQGVAGGKPGGTIHTDHPEHPERQKNGQLDVFAVNQNPALGPVEIVALYPRRQSQSEAVLIVARHIADGADPQSIADGTRAIAAVISQMPSGPLNAYVPAADTFFRKKKWEDDPQSWLRNAAPGNRNNGAQPQPLSLGGRKATTIKIGS
jgi:hypothetical protein